MKRLLVVSLLTLSLGSCDNSHEPENPCREVYGVGETRAFPLQGGGTLYLYGRALVCESTP